MKVKTLLRWATIYSHSMALICSANLELDLGETCVRRDVRIQLISASRSIQRNLHISSQSHISTIDECRVPTSSEGRVSTSNEGRIFIEVRVQKKTKWHSRLHQWKSHSLSPTQEYVLTSAISSTVYRQRKSTTILVQQYTDKTNQSLGSSIVHCHRPKSRQDQSSGHVKRFFV